jgi:DHA2 family multidrug resistance protein
LWPNVVRAIGQALILTPLSAVATAGIEAENAGSASGLFNMMRNLGGAVGIAMLQTFLTKREQYHSNVLMQSVSLLEQATRTRIEQLTQYFVNHGVIDPADAAHRALVAIGHIVQKQAFILAFSDTFYLLGATLLVALMATLLLKKPGQLAGGGAH